MGSALTRSPVLTGTRSSQLFEFTRGYLFGGCDSGPDTVALDP